MKNAKKLNKKELKTITGGSFSCIDEKGRCKITGTGCAERACWYVPEPPFD
ncbi:bacteriocin-like protein [Chryseobacterium jejuense]|uniref:bacteriocin-like protein n=1 Tax=Chryseobacterium jejuense TaxID=445960 RepID=UPI001AE63D84|nr:bacteriocin [Chryseobacterium jejuense]MBP2615276.1 bacteriocin-like protein [Chryseobacterium jejuense]